jgi:tetratricopeptide (TPR) repeat protein
LAALIVVVAVALAYVQVLGGPFLWDDRALILAAPVAGHAATLGDYLQHPFWAGGAGPQSASYYRPLVTLSFALDRQLHGDNPAGYHLTNFLLHETNALLLYFVIRRAKVRPSVAALLAVAWGLQPRLAEAAAWISGRTDLLASACVLASLLAWGNSLARRIAASLLVTAGLLAKESAVAGVLALVVLEWVNAPDGSASARRGFVGRRSLPLLVAVAGSVWLRWSVVGARVEGESLGALKRALTVLQTLGMYAVMMVDAFRPRAVIGRVGVLSGWSIVVGVVVLLGAAAWAGWTLRRRSGPWRPWTVVGLTLLIGALLPVLHIVPIPLRTLAADRFLYLPSAGLALALAPGVDRWLGTRRSAWLPALTLVAALGWFTSERARVWADEVEFWVQTYLETPDTNSTAATDLVGVFYRAGLYRDALTLAQREHNYRDPSKADARFNEALCLERLGRLEEALALLLASSSRRHAADTQTQIAILELKLGRAGAARARLETLARDGYAPARQLMARIPEFTRAQAELARTPQEDAERRARLASLLGDEAIAVPAWLDATNRPEALPATFHEALSYLVQTGDRAAIMTTVRRYVARYGALQPDLVSIVSLRIEEIDRLLAVRARLGLGQGRGPER